MKHTRSVLVAALSGAAIALSVAACSSVPAVPSPVPAAPVPVLAAPVAASPTLAAPATTKKKLAPKTTTPKATSTKSEVDTSRCTNRIDYASDPRDNATINTIGEQTGKCPKPLTSATDGAGGGKGAGYTGTCLDTGTCYDPAGSAAGEGLSDEEYASSGEAQYAWGCRQGYITEGC